MKTLKSVLIALSILLTPFVSFADDNPGRVPIDLGGKGGTGNKGDQGNKPKIPSQQQLSCYLEDETIVVSARQHETADVVISDAVTGQIVVQRFVALCPEACIDLTGINGPLTIDITVASGTYSGSFIK